MISYILRASLKTGNHADQDYLSIECIIQKLRMKTYIVQLVDHDDIISAREKISWSKARRVLLVWPRRGRVLERRVDLLLVQRHCLQLGFQVAIVSKSGDVRWHAADLGIPVFSNAVQAQRSIWRYPKSHSEIIQLARGDSHMSAQASGLRQTLQGFRLAPDQRNWLRYSMFCVGVFSFLALVLFFAPGAKIILKPLLTPQQIVLPIRVQTGITAANPSGDIPAHVISAIVEGSDQIQSTSMVSIPKDKAGGEVLLTNLTGQPVKIPQGSIVQTAGKNPVQFSTTRAVLLPGKIGASQVVSVLAVTAGRQGNVPAGQIITFESDLGYLASVTNSRPITGGSDQKNPAPGADDYQLLQERVLGNLKERAAEELSAQLESSQQLMIESLVIHRVIEKKWLPERNQPGDWLQLTMRVEYRAWFVETSDLRAVAQSGLNANLPDGSQPIQSSLNYEFEFDPQPQDFTDTQMLSGKLSAAWDLKPEYSRSQIVQYLPGLTIDQAVELIESHVKLSQAPRVELFPVWWNRMPFLPFRIDVVEE